MKKLFAAILCGLLAGCATGPVYDTTYTSINQESRVLFLVIHYTSDNFPISLKTLVESTRRPVSSHYLVRDNPPTVYRLVDENRRAYHAGVSSWQGHTNINSSSIGIEIVNLGINKPGWDPYPPEQVEAIVALVKDIVKRHKIRPDRIVGHSDIAPTRKVDPGPLFPWKRLADEGLIYWPDPGLVAMALPQYERELPDIDWFQEKLARHGYGLALNGQLDETTRATISAFQMKYRPSKYDGMPDAETAAILDVLVGR